MAVTTWQKRVDSGDWDAITAEVNDFGGALLPRLLTKAEAETIRELYPDDHLFRSTIDMRRYRFGEGEYRYFQQPYPEPIQALKESLYPRLLPIAREWWTKLGRTTPWPDDLDDWLDMCHKAGQKKSTAILLKYGKGDWNALHRDLYGDLVFPLQVVITSANRASTTPVVSSCSSSSDRAHNRAAPRPCCRSATALSSRRASGRCNRRGVGPRPRSGMVCRPSAPASDTHSASYFTTQHENPRHDQRPPQDTNLRSAGLSVGAAGHRARRLRYASRFLRRRGHRRRRGLPAVRSVHAGALQGVES